MYCTYGLPPSRFMLRFIIILLSQQAIFPSQQHQQRQHLVQAQSDEVQALIPDALPQCATVCDSYHLQMVASECRKANPSVDIMDLNVARCTCTDRPNMEWYAACLTRTCSDEMGSKVGEVIEKAYSKLEKTICAKQNTSVVLTREEFFQTAGVDQQQNSTAVAGGGDANTSIPPSRTMSTIETTGVSSNIPPSSSSSSSSSASNIPSTGGAGMSTSDKIAIGVGLGIGIPTMVIALLTFVFTCRWPLPWLKRFQKGKTVAQGGEAIEQTDTYPAEGIQSANASNVSAGNATTSR